MAQKNVPKSVKSLFLIWLTTISFTALGQSNDTAVAVNPNIETLEANHNVSIEYLEVPEDHYSANSRRIKIAYTVLKARQPENYSAPIIYLAGGPGANCLTARNIDYWQNSTLNEKKDVILFDQRGINFSSPLPNMSKDLFDIQAQDIDMITESKHTGKIFNKYRKKAMEMNISLESYTSFENAKDVGLLMNKLGHKKYNLYGVSYGTRLGRIIQDMFPEKINSVTLNSPALFDSDFLLLRLKSYAIALERVFIHCEQNSECTLNYPDIRNVYVEAIQALEGKPLLVHTSTGNFFVNSQDGIYIIRNALYGNESRQKAPLIIYALKKRDEKGISDILEKMYSSTNNYNASMWLSVESYEQFNKNSKTFIDSIYNLEKIFPSKLGLLTSLYANGEKLQPNRLSKHKRFFKKSKIPTIIFVNYFDPVTPPENGLIFQKMLTKSNLFILDEGGHSGGNWECKQRVMLEFMNSPLEPFNFSCLNLHEPRE